MKNKIKRYYNYLIKFSKSPHKKEIFRDLTSEMKTKGVVDGIRSLLHQKVHGKTYRAEQGSLTGKLFKFDLSTRIILPAPASPKVSIIIPMYNQLAYTYDCVYSIYKNAGIDSYEIIIADDNSAEDSSILPKNFENIQIVRNPENLGFLRNCNNAAKHARGEYLVFLNNDTQVREGWLSELLYVFDNFENVGVVGSKLVYPDGRMQEAGGILWQDASAWNFGNLDDPRKYEYNYLKEADYVSGASLMITRKLWEEIGGFDDAFAPAYCEDSDLCFNAWQKGYKVIYNPFSVVIHFEGISHGTNLRRGVKKNQTVNQKKFLQKWKKQLSGKSRNGEHIFVERDRSVGKKHVVVVDHYLPQIDKDAGSRTISNFMDSFLQLGYHVIFLGENQNLEKQYQESFQRKGVEVLYGREFNFFDQSWKHYLKKHLKDIDAFLLSRSHISLPFMLFLRSNGYTGKIIYYGHDLGYMRLEKEAVLKNDKSLHVVAQRIKASEDYMYQNADYSLVISQEETDFLKQYIVSPLKYVPPYFFDVSCNTPAFDKREGLFFIGGFNHPPNQDAMKWFLDEVYGPLHEKGIPFTVAGSKMPEFIYEYKKKYKLLSVKPDISVADLDEVYDKVRVVVVPLLSGAGVKGKVIEAMAKGVPVAGTSIAFEGMVKDENYICRGADTADAMRNSILEVYNDKNNWEKYVSFGKNYVSENFNKEKMKQVFKDIIG